MQQFEIQMPRINDCEISNCAYNISNACHAKAITIGDGDTPHCDTFLKSSPHSNAKNLAGVGACKISACTYNTNYECQAEAISIGMENNSAMCVTFSV